MTSRFASAIASKRSSHARSAAPLKTTNTPTITVSGSFKGAKFSYVSNTARSLFFLAEGARTGIAKPAGARDPLRVTTRPVRFRCFSAINASFTLLRSVASRPRLALAPTSRVTSPRRRLASASESSLDAASSTPMDDPLDSVGLSIRGASLASYIASASTRTGQHAIARMLDRLRHALTHYESGAVVIEWFRPLAADRSGRRSNLALHARIFSGYGDSLVDYNYRRTVVSYGLSLIDF